jgi:hypothetical protein
MTLPAKQKQSPPEQDLLKSALASAGACRWTAELLARNSHLDPAARDAVAPVLRMAMAEEERARRIMAMTRIAP